MHRIPPWRRLAAVFALVFSLTAVFIAVPNAVAQEGDSSIEVHNRVCPPDYQGDNWYEDCHSDVPDPGLPFTFQSGDVTRSGTTNENGNVGFANLPAGTWTVTGGAPGEFTDYVVYCSTESPDVQVPVAYVAGGVQFELGSNTNVICDWYTIPISQGDTQTPTPTELPLDDSTIEIHDRICPPDYQGENWFDDCHSNPAAAGFTFTLTDGATREATTNESGNAGFSNLPEGTYTITSSQPTGETELIVYCAVGTEAESNQSQIPVDYVTGGIQIDVPVDTNIICDWYVIPSAGPTPTPELATFDLPIYTLLCGSAPGTGALGDFVTVGNVPADCEQYAGARVEVVSQAGEVYGSCETDATEPCYVTVDVGAGVVATVDLSTLPADSTLVDGQSQEIEIEPATEASVVFIAVAAVQTPTVVPPTPTPTSTPLPEARPVLIATGTCEIAAADDSVVTLTDLRLPQGTPVGLDDAVTAETSTSTIDLSLDDLTGSDHVVLVYAADDIDASGDPVACAPIGGVVNDGGELVIGLKERNESDYTGIVYLAPVQGDPSRTGISVFLAEDLAQPTPTTTPGA